jgi:hypothetical protein
MSSNDTLRKPSKPAAGQKGGFLERIWKIAQIKGVLQA